MSSTMWKLERGKMSTLNEAWLWLCDSLQKERNAYFFIFMRKYIFWEDETSQKTSKCWTEKSLKSFFNFTLLQYSFYLNILSVHFTNFQAVVMLPDWQCPAEPGSSGASLCQPEDKTQWHNVLSAPNCFWSGSWDTRLTGDSAITAVRQALLQWCCHGFTHGFKVMFINPTHKGFILKTIRHLKCLQPPTFQESSGYPGSRLFSLQHSTYRASMLCSPLEAV